MARILPESLEYLSNKGMHTQAQALADKLDINYQAPVQQHQQKQSIKDIVAVVFAWRYLRATTCFG